MIKPIRRRTVHLGNLDLAFFEPKTMGIGPRNTIPPAPTTSWDRPVNVSLSEMDLIWDTAIRTNPPIKMRMEATPNRPRIAITGIMNRR